MDDNDYDDQDDQDYDNDQHDDDVYERNLIVRAKNDVWKRAKRVSLRLLPFFHQVFEFYISSFLKKKNKLASLEAMLVRNSAD